MRSADEKMNVIGHDHVLSHCDVMIGIRFCCEGNKRLMRRIRCQHLFALMCAECDEEHRIVWKDQS